MKYVFFVCLFLCGLGSAMAAGGLSAQKAGEDLLVQVAERTASIGTLHAAFTQEKILGILDAPLVSSGQLCLERADGEAEPTVVWAYEKPAISGFAYEQGKGWLWTDARARKREATGMEAVALKAVTEHILAWIRVQPEALRRMYSMERLPDAGASPALRLVPKQQSSFFASLEVTFVPTLEAVQKLRFVEKNGDSATLIFEQVRINTPLPAQCKGDAAP